MTRKSRRWMTAAPPTETMPASRPAWVPFQRETWAFYRRINSGKHPPLVVEHGLRAVPPGDSPADHRRCGRK